MSRPKSNGLLHSIIKSFSHGAWITMLHTSLSAVRWKVLCCWLCTPHCVHKLQPVDKVVSSFKGRGGWSHPSVSATTHDILHIVSKALPQAAHPDNITSEFRCTGITTVISPAKMTLPQVLSLISLRQQLPHFTLLIGPPMAAESSAALTDCCFLCFS